MKIFLIVILFVALAIVLLVLLNLTKEEATQTPQATPTPTPTPTAEGGGAQTATVTLTQAGLEPSQVTVNQGDTVRFVNATNQPFWPASGIHPTHALYPVGGGCIGSAFDACRNLGQGEGFSFTFNIKGTWPFHNHLNPSATGRVIVQ